MADIWVSAELGSSQKIAAAPQGSDKHSLQGVEND
jgi:hypothetical protein